MSTANAWPRRNTVGALVASGLALFGLSKGISGGTAKKKGKNKPKPPTLLLSDEAIFNVAEGESNSGSALCPAGSLVVSGQVTITNPLCTPVILGFNSAILSGWQLTLKCPAGQSSAGNTSQALCLKGAQLGN